MPLEEFEPQPHQDFINANSEDRPMATKDTIKLAGPDRNDNYMVLATKGTLIVRPGEIYSEHYVQKRLLDFQTKKRIDTSIIVPKFDTDMRKEFGKPVK